LTLRLLVPLAEAAVTQSGLHRPPNRTMATAGGIGFCVGDTGGDPDQFTPSDEGRPDFIDRSSQAP
jgi:hypothetical protein